MSKNISGSYFWFLFYIEDHHHLSNYQQDNFPQKQRTSGRRKEGKMEGWIREEKGRKRQIPNVTWIIK